MHVGVSEISCKTGSTKGYSSSLEKKLVMVIDEDPFPSVASANTASFDIKYCLVHVDRLKKKWATVCTRRNSVGIQ